MINDINIVARATFQRVDAHPAVQRVIARTAEQAVIAAAGIEGIVAVIARHPIGGGVAGANEIASAIQKQVFQMF